MSPFEALRSLLFVPADRPDRFAKAAASGAGAVILDLEDGVAEADKAVALAAVPDGIAAIRAVDGRVLVRVNAGARGLADLAALAGQPADGFVLPKVEAPSDVTAAADALAAAGRPVPANLVALVETPRGIVAAAAIAEAGRDLAALAFGAEDFAAAMGVPPGAEELGHAARTVAIAARAAGLPAFGVIGSIADIRNLAAYEAACRRARSAGFAGALAIHPAQVPVAERAFAPSPDEIAWAHAVLEDAAADPSGALVSRDGRMIDKPVIERARRVLSRAS